MNSTSLWREGLAWKKQAGWIARLLAAALDIHPPRPLRPLKVIKRALRCRRSGHNWTFLYETVTHSLLRHRSDKPISLWMYRCKSCFKIRRDYGDS